MQKAEHPFQFVNAAYLTRIGNLCAKNLDEMREGLETCSDASVFYHTFQSLERLHFLTVGFSNDFAHWAISALNRGELAEQMAALEPGRCRNSAKGSTGSATLRFISIS
jgi:hypothetical protein